MTKRVLITGCTGNVGQACVNYFSKNDWAIVGVARNTKLSTENKACKIFPLDLSHSTQVYDFLAAREPFDMVIMAHGTQTPIRLGDPGFYFRCSEVMTSNLSTAICLTSYLFELNLMTKDSLILYCSSIQATQPRAGRGPYAVAKAGLEALAKIVGVEGATFGIRSIALRLGQLNKTMKGIYFEPDQIEAIQERTPLPWVSCDDVAKLCLDLYSQKSMTGTEIDLDSGHHLNVWP